MIIIIIIVIIDNSNNNNNNYNSVPMMVGNRLKFVLIVLWVCGWQKCNVFALPCMSLRVTFAIKPLSFRNTLFTPVVGECVCVCSCLAHTAHTHTPHAHISNHSETQKAFKMFDVSFRFGWTVTLIDTFESDIKLPMFLFRLHCSRLFFCYRSLFFCFVLLPFLWFLGVFLSVLFYVFICYYASLQKSLEK